MGPITPEAIKRYGRLINERMVSAPRKARFWFLLNGQERWNVEVDVLPEDDAETVAWVVVNKLRTRLPFAKARLITGRYLPEAA